MRGIYKIIVKEKVYYGSCEDFQIRKDSHKYHLRRNIHFNKRLQNLWNKQYDFVFEFIEEVEGDLLAVEQVYIDKHYGKSYCLNLSPVAGGGKLYIPTEKTIKKQLETKKQTGRWGGANENSWKAAALANTGVTRSKKAREKMSLAKKKFYNKNPDLLRENQERGRKSRWEKQCKLFYLQKGDKQFGPYRRQKDVPSNLLSNVSVSRLYLSKKVSIKGFTIKFPK